MTKEFKIFIIVFSLVITCLMLFTEKGGTVGQESVTNQDDELNIYFYQHFIVNHAVTGN